MQPHVAVPEKPRDGFILDVAMITKRCLCGRLDFTRFHKYQLQLLRCFPVVFLMRQNRNFPMLRYRLIPVCIGKQIRLAPEPSDKY